MKIIRPNVITDAMLISSDIPETDYAAYNAATTYVGGDRCIDTARHKIYESLPSSGIELLTLDVAPAVPWLPNWTLTGQTSLQTCVVCQYLTSLTYLVRARSGVFTLGEVIGVTGTAVLLADQGGANPTFASAANKARTPSVDVALATPLWWKEVSGTNRWKVFDSSVGSQSSQAASMTFDIAPGKINAIAFLNLEATSISLVQTDPGDGVAFTATYDLVSSAAIIDGYSYCFEPFIFLTSLVVFDLPPYELATISITITNVGGVAKCGGIVMGLSTFLGTTLYGPSIGITDYSQKTTDDYGNYSITEGAFSRRGSYALKVPNTSINEVERILSLYRATPLVWVGIDEIAATITYGTFKSFDIVISGPSFSDCGLDIEGLT